jgi:Tfp pilus assembly protein PilP
MLALLTVLLLLISASSGAAQTPAPAPAQTPAGTAAAPAAEVDSKPLEPRGFTYDPGGRRDPFVSLLRSGSDEQREVRPRPSGLAGLLVSEISLKGIVASGADFVAILQGADSKAYVVREGEMLLDGSVRSITQNSITLLEQGSDRLSDGTPHEVRKVLRQTDEAK